MREIVVYEIANVQPATPLARVHAGQRECELGVGRSESPATVQRIAGKRATPRCRRATVLPSCNKRRVDTVDLDEIPDCLSGDPCVAWQHARRAVENPQERGATLANRGFLGRRRLVVALVAAP